MIKIYQYKYLGQPQGQPLHLYHRRLVIADLCILTINYGQLAISGSKLKAYSSKLIFPFYFLLFTFSLNAQQLKRQTLAGSGKVQSQPTFRVSYTAGSCPGCSVIHPGAPATAGFLRQGFQQPSTIPQPATCLVAPLQPQFLITQTTSLCGTKFDFEFIGSQIANAIYTWNFGDGATPKTSNQLTPSTVIYTSTGNKNISLSILVLGCNAVSSAKIVSVGASQLGFVADVALVGIKCFGSASGSIALTPKGGVAPIAVKWSNSAITNSITNLAAGRYKAILTDANNCTFNVDTVVAQPAAALGFTFSKTDEACKGFSDGNVTLSPSGGTTPYKIAWSNNTTGLTRDSLTAGRYAFTLIDSNSCKLDSAVYINDRCKTDKSTYDIITPNGDGNNDVLIVPGLDKYPNNQMFIYNRWGQLVYTKKSYQNDWDGTTNDGKLLTTGAYYFVIYLNDATNKQLNGSVTVVR